MGDAALTADVAVTFRVSANNTLEINWNIGAYANPVAIAAVLRTGATQP